MSLTKSRLLGLQIPCLIWKVVPLHFNLQLYMGFASFSSLYTISHLVGLTAARLWSMQP